MAGHPADIGRAPIDVFIANVEDVLGGRINAHQITPGGVQNSLRLSSGSAGIEKINRVLAVERNGGTLYIYEFQFPTPPDVAAFFLATIVPDPPKTKPQ